VLPKSLSTINVTSLMNGPIHDSVLVNIKKKQFSQFLNKFGNFFFFLLDGEEPLKGLFNVIQSVS